MSTFVLIHGAWSGAHVWRAVRKRLAERGHEVFTPSLTGIGERSHLVSPQVGLGTHVDDVVNHVLFEDLRDMVVVAFSYGGAVATAAVPRLHDRIRELVYLDAFVPADGESVAVLAGREQPTVPDLGDTWLVPPPERDFDDPDEAAWQSARRVPHPLRCFTETVRLSTPLEDHGFGLTYIKATSDSREAPGGEAFWKASEHARESTRWRHHEIATGHMVTSNRPDELATLLDEIASAAGT